MAASITKKQLRAMPLILYEKVRAQIKTGNLTKITTQMMTMKTMII